eukprot:gene967-1293_t
MALPRLWTLASGSPAIIPLPGYFLAVASRRNQQAQLCPKNTYSPGMQRIRQCLRCQSGLEEEPAFTAAAGGEAPAAGVKVGDVVTVNGQPVTVSQLRANKINVCGVPAGRYISQNVVRDCPAGTFRSTHVLPTDEAARYCNPCPKVGQPGYQLSQDNLLSQETPDGGPSPDLCPRGTFFPGGQLP